MSPRTQLPSWKALTELAIEMKSTTLNQLFNEDLQRANQYSVNFEGLLFDYSKNYINEEVKTALTMLCQEVELSAWRDKLFNGTHINQTENRAVLHTALRDSSGASLQVDGDNVEQLVAEQLEKMKLFVESVRAGNWLGYSGESITDVVSIGVGGSNLGPQMVTEGLKAYSDGELNVHYVSNVDGAQIQNVLSALNPKTTLFIVSSKTFTTSETMTNAKTATQWLLACADDVTAISKHFVAVSANVEKAIEFGICKENIFSMWDWVGGRFSLWSAIGLPIALDLGFEQYQELLSGANAVDEHFKTAEFKDNIPVLMALISVFNTTFLGHHSQAILPYEQSLHRLPAYLQQAEMESNGKSVSWQGEKIPYQTVPLLWGEIGINGQHAFYQCLHQGKTIVPADFIGAVQSATPIDNHHQILMANFFAQSQALMSGVNEQDICSDLKSKGFDDNTIEQLASHKVHEGNRPTNTFLFKKITPRSLGQLIALYEHKIFAQGIILGICSFDQWGVELGKGLAVDIEHQLATQQISSQLDSSTANLMRFYYQHS